MGFEVNLANVDAAYEQYLAYADGRASVLGEAMVALETAFSQFYRMESFQGDAARSLKDYLSEYHSALRDAFVELRDQLKLDFALHYMQRYYEAPLAERGDARLPEQEMEQKRALLAHAKDARVPSISGNFAQVIARNPPGDVLPVPSTACLSDAFTCAHDDVERAKNATQAIEEEARQRFTSQSSNAAQLMAQLRHVIQDYVVSKETLQAGGYRSFLLSDSYLHLALAEERVQDERGDLKEELLSAHQQLYERQILREEERYAIFEEGRSQWELVGIGASVLGTLASAAAIVCTGGVATAVLSGAGALRSGADAFSRIQDRINGVNGSERMGGRTKTTADSVKQAASSSAVSVMSRLVPSRTSNPLKMLGSSARGTVSVLGKASQAATVLADDNHDRMRADAQASLKRIEELKAKRLAVA